MKPKKISGCNMIQASTRRWWPLFLGPVVAAFVIGFVWPFIQGIYLSFCQFKLIADAKPIGFGNYIRDIDEDQGYHGVQRRVPESVGK